MKECRFCKRYESNIFDEPCNSCFWESKNIFRLLNLAINFGSNYYSPAESAGEPR